MKNVCDNRGESDYFVDDVIVLDKKFAKPLMNLEKDTTNTAQLGTKDNPIYIRVVNE